MDRRITTTAVCSALTMIALAACGATGPGRAESAGGGSAEAASPFTPPPTHQGSKPSSPDRCGGRLYVGVDTANPPAPVCLQVGQELRLAAGASPQQPWETFTSSDPAVVSCTSTRLPDGAVQAICRARRPGTATITTGTMPFAGDPHGPVQHIWQLAVTVKA
jgi:hypothetical protein